MTCPYLTQVTMVFCQAAPVKKLIPTDRVSTASACEADAYRACPLFREALARAHQTIEEVEEEEKALHPAEEKGALP
jgi:tRNA U34 5-methylaminomethyl-2-thiouridine-forming methyltransferase MnmC